MALFLDSADLDQIRSAMDLGIYSGVTTNPALLANIPVGEVVDHLGEIARVCRKSLYIQVDLRSEKDMERQALTLVEIAPGRTVIKIPISFQGLKVCAALSARGVPVCMTAVFSPGQAFAAGCALAHSVAIYVGRITKRGENGVQVAERAAQTLRAAKLPTRVLAASISDSETLENLLTLPDIDVTIPYSLQEALLRHPGTDEAIAGFAPVAC